MKKWICYFLILILIPLKTLADEYFEDDTESKYKPKVYTLFDDITLTSKKDVQYDKPRVVVRIVYPSLTSETENENVDFFNEAITEIINNEKNDFINKAKELNAKSNRNDLYIDYDVSFLRSGKHHILSIRFSMQGYISALAHPYHYHKVFNYDIDHAQVLELQDLFKSESDYLTIISQYSSQILGRRLSNKQMISEGTMANSDNFKNWNLKPNGILFTFDEYQVAPYIDGAQTVLVPYGFLLGIIPKQSPISSCSKNRRSCRYSSILTGGFIDEASIHGTSRNCFFGSLRRCTL